MKKLPKFPPKPEEWRLGKPFKEPPLPKWFRGGTISFDDLKIIRSKTEEIRKAEKAEDEEWALRATLEREKLLASIVNGERRERAIYLFDADFWLEKAGNMADEADLSEIGEDKEKRDDIWDMLDESVSYWDSCHNRGWIDDAEHNEMVRYCEEARKALVKYDWRDAAFRIGDADKVAKVILADRMK